MSSAERLDPAHGELLLDVALESIGHGLRRGEPLAVDPTAYPEPLREQRASFVSLHRGGSLRGCTGSLEANQPLVTDVARSAHRSAFGDPRFPALEERELPDLELEISVLSALEPLEAHSEEDLLGKLRPGVDGLVIREGTLYSTFLPAVWKSLPEPAAFLAELRRKAGLPRSHWSRRLSFQRYTVEMIRREPAS